MNFSITLILCVVNFLKNLKLNITSYKIIIYVCVCGVGGVVKNTEKEE